MSFFIGILQEQGQFRGSCGTGSNTPGWVKTPESCSWGALRRTSRQQNMDYVGQSLSSLFGSKCCSIPWGRNTGKACSVPEFPDLGLFFFFIFFISWVLRASFLLPGEGKLLCNKRIISTLAGHGTSMFTHEDPHVLCCCLVFNLYAMCIVLSACVFVYHVHTWSTLRPEEGTGVPGTGCTNVSCSVGARKQIWVLWKSSQYSQ